MDRYGGRIEYVSSLERLGVGLLDACLVCARQTVVVLLNSFSAYVPSFDRHILINLTAVIGVVLHRRGLHPLPDSGKHEVVLR